MLKAILVLFLVYFAYSCPDNCFCTEYSAQCVILGCTSEIDTSYDTLIIEGSLCKYHRELLQNLEDFTDIFLANDKCNEIPNCRFVFFFKKILHNIYFTQHLFHTTFISHNFSEMKWVQS